MGRSGILGRVKPRRRILLAVLGLAFAVVLVAVLWPGQKEPEYQGKKLSEWLLTYVNPVALDPVRQDQALNAVRHIGTNGLPFLVKWISYREPNWRDKLANALIRSPVPFARTRLVHLVLGSSGTRARVAMLGFQILREDAVPAVPALTNLLGDWSAQESTFRVLHALGYVGKEGLPPLLAVVTNKAVPVQYRCLATQMMMPPTMNPGTNALWVVPLLLPYLQEAPVMACIANVLSLWRLAPGEVVPALTRCLRSPEALVRTEAAEMLPRFGSEASSAVPELLMVLSDTDRMVRVTATNALRRIAPEELKKHEQ